jgi:Saxitoxin biosynthesis operon protein SxtJ
VKWSDISFAPSDRTLRQFAVLWVLFFGGAACWKSGANARVDVAVALAALALAVGVIGLTKPGWIRFLYVGWMVLAFPIGWTVSYLLLAVLFFGAFTPIALLFKLLGRDALERRPQSNRETYWTPKRAPSELRNYLRQF